MHRGAGNLLAFWELTETREAGPGGRTGPCDGVHFPSPCQVQVPCGRLTLD